MKKLVLLVLVCGLGIGFSGCKNDEDEANTVKGTVRAYDADLEESYIAEGATCYLHNGKAEAYIKTATVNKSGEFIFNEVPNGEYQISVKYTNNDRFAQPVSYSARTASFNLNGGETHTEDITCK